MSNSNASTAAGSALHDLVDLLENRYTIPGTNVRIGLDAILGLIPGIGDFLGALLGAVIVVEGWRRGVGTTVIGRMLFNLWIDAALGSVPVIGDVFDIWFKANRRNLQLLEKHSS